MTERDTPFERFRLAGATEQQLRLLEAALKQAPELNERATRAMRGDDLTRIRLLEPGGNLGQYSGYYREIGFKPDLLSKDIRQRNVDGVVDVFSHEIEHALRRKEMLAFDTAFEHKAYASAEQPGPRDATALVREYIDKGRQQESLAELAGINGLADRMRTEGKGPVTESALARRLEQTSSCVEPDGIGGFRFKEGIRFDPRTQSVPVTVQNLDAVGKHFFDIERGGNDYKALYAAAAISALARGEAALRSENPLLPTAQTRINLAALGVNEADLRKQEFNFGINPPGPFAFTDSSPGKNRVVEAADTGRHDKSRGAAPEVALDPINPAHPDHAAFARILKTVGADGRWNPEQSTNITAALLLAYKQEPTVKQVDDVALIDHNGVTRAVALRTPHGDRDPKFHIAVDANQSAQLPAHDSFSQLEVVNRHLEMERQRELEPQKQKQQEQSGRQGLDGTPSPPVMRH